LWRDRHGEVHSGGFAGGEVLGDAIVGRGRGLGLHLDVLSDIVLVVCEAVGVFAEAAVE